MLQKTKYRSAITLRAACLLVIFGIWIEKGMGLIFPGIIFLPPGTYMEYVPSWHEVVLCVAILALGALLFSLMTKVSIAIQTGSLRHKPEVR